jgi:hypothetical protein
MERRVKEKMDTYMSEFKQHIRDKSVELKLTDQEDVSKLLQCVFDYKSIDITKQDFVKRKRIKPEIYISDRCIAKRACDEQCSRKKKADSDFCGTHMKGLPYGSVDGNKKQKQDGKGDEKQEKEVMISDEQEQVIPVYKKVEVWVQDIKGIVYYLDKEGNVYQTEDIIRNLKNPRIIAKYIKVGDDYSIIDFL